MRTIPIISFAAVALAGFSSFSMAEDTTVVHRGSGPSVAVQHREGVVNHRDVTTDSFDCVSRTVHKGRAGNAKNLRKERCD
jgi:hypothetical protein